MKYKETRKLNKALKHQVNVLKTWDKFCNGQKSTFNINPKKKLNLSREDCAYVRSRIADAVRHFECQVRLKKRGFDPLPCETKIFEMLVSGC